MKYDKNLNSINQNKKVRREEPEHLQVPAFVQTPPSKRPANPHREQKVQANTRRHKRRHKKNYILYYIFLILLLLVVGVSLSLTVLFNIEQIVVTGNVGITEQEIIASSKAHVGENLFRLNTDKAAQNVVAKHLTIDKVTVRRQLPNQLAIEVVMATTKAEIRYKDKSYSLSQSNKVIGIDTPQLNENALRVVGCDFADVALGQQVTADDKNKLAVIDTVVSALADRGLTQVKVIDVTDEMTIKLYYEDRYIIKIGGVLDIDYKLQWAANLIDFELNSENEMGTIDVSVNNGMYYFRHADKIDVP